MTGPRRGIDPADIIVGVLQCLRVGAPRSWEVTALSQACGCLGNTRGSAGPDHGRENRRGRTANETAEHTCVSKESRQGP